MKKTVLLTILISIFCVGVAQAKKKPKIQFENTTINLGTFTQNDPIRTCTFKFKNVGDAKLVINYVNPSCGCTVAEFPKDFIAPGASGEIKVTYDGSNKYPGRFRKSITVFTNGGTESTRLYIEGNMTLAQQTK